MSKAANDQNPALIDNKQQGEVVPEPRAVVSADRINLMTDKVHIRRQNGDTHPESRQENPAGPLQDTEPDSLYGAGITNKQKPATTHESPVDLGAPMFDRKGEPIVYPSESRAAPEISFTRFGQIMGVYGVLTGVFGAMCISLLLIMWVLSYYHTSYIYQ